METYVFEKSRLLQFRQLIWRIATNERLEVLKDLKRSNNFKYMYEEAIKAKQRRFVCLTRRCTSSCQKVRWVSRSGEGAWQDYNEVKRKPIIWLKSIQCWASVSAFRCSVSRNLSDAASDHWSCLRSDKKKMICHPTRDHDSFTIDAQEFARAGINRRESKRFRRAKTSCGLSNWTMIRNSKSLLCGRWNCQTCWFLQLWNEWPDADGAGLV